METKQPFKILSKICLNNWHYINRKVLSFSEGVNFFTGHSGSGKSTVIDALQIVLYANTDGRGFFNKAAADDSDRTLIEYLRGMVNISDNNESQYLRNQNFSSTIVLEFTHSGTGEKECVGVVFDVETATNEVSRLFFWHAGGILDNHYRGEKRVLSTAELKEYFQRMLPPERYYCGPSNERFRRQLYDVYLGGLDMEKFPRLFKRAIPFRMNIKLEEFVKEYICMEQDIHIEDLQESVMQYGRMRARIEETLAEVEKLRKIREIYDAYEAMGREARSGAYQVTRLEILQLTEKIQECRDKMKNREEGAKEQERQLEQLAQEQQELQKEYEEILVKIADSGYSRMETELAALNETIQRLETSKGRWDQTARRLEAWKETDSPSNQTLWDIKKFVQGNISPEELVRLQESLQEIRRELEEQRQEAAGDLRRIKREEKETKEELEELKKGSKAYPRELEEARYELRRRLHENCGRFVNVQILADLLDIWDERWHNAVEGYLGNNKLLLVVEPAYAKMAMDIYQDMDRKKFCRAAVLDTEKVLEGEYTVREGALAEEVKAREPYVRAYIDFLLGNVIKCETISELRQQKIGVTPDCMLYSGFRLQHMNPENYTSRAYIGETSMRQRIRRLEKRREKLQEERLPIQELLEEVRRLMELEGLTQPAEDYLGWMADCKELSGKRKRKEKLIQEMEELREVSVNQWEERKKELLRQQEEKKGLGERLQESIWSSRGAIKHFREEILEAEEQLSQKRKELTESTADKAFAAASEESEETGEQMAAEALWEKEFQEYLASRKSRNYEYLKKQKQAELDASRQKAEEIYQQLVEERGNYIRSYPNRTFSTTIRENGPYDKLLEDLSCGELEEYREAAKEQARSAVEHFKDDFIFKIRSAIREALQRKDELNRILSRLDFGKDRYQFVITRNKGADGQYYKMFMDDSLQIQPSQLENRMDHQMNLFTMEHEDQYGEMMNELIQIFIPPENVTKEEAEAAKRNMEKYADYRTYLSFDMQQIVQGEKDMTIGLGKMIKKNSGGEGQNPLYVALLASFAQIYRINLSPKVYRKPTIRLVVLDEAFSKMDAEKVASCISLIRGLGFQAIISATNDKIQNYLENVDKTFVYANPDKKHISIQEFEKQDFAELEVGPWHF